LSIIYLLWEAFWKFENEIAQKFYFCF
jgi:hypothetical protein